MTRELDMYEAMRKLARAARVLSLEECAFLYGHGFKEEQPCSDRWCLKDPVYGDIVFIGHGKLGGFIWHEMKPPYRYFHYRFPFSGSIQGTYERMEKGIIRVLSEGYSPEEEELEELSERGYREVSSSSGRRVFKNEGIEDARFCIFEDGWSFSKDDEIDILFSKELYAALTDAWAGLIQDRNYSREYFYSCRQMTTLT